MSGVGSCWFRFDGNCEASRGADLTITFTSGLTLKAHSSHLKEASPVLRRSLRYSQPGDTYHAGNDNIEGWILLLNLIHPSRRMRPVGPAAISDLHKLEILAPLARQYEIVGMLDFVDCSLRQVITHSKAAVPEIVDGSEIQRFLDWSGLLRKSSVLAAQFALPASKEACVEYFRKIVYGIKNGAMNGDEICQRATVWISDYVAFLSRLKHDEFAARLVHVVMPLLYI